jgi:hypothetical protein
MLCEGQVPTFRDTKLIPALEKLGLLDSEANSRALARGLRDAGAWKQRIHEHLPAELVAALHGGDALAMLLVETFEKLDMGG